MKTTILLVLTVLLTGVRPLIPQVLYVRTGEMVALQCPRCHRHSGNGAEPLWTSDAVNLTNSNSSAAEQREMDVLLSGRSLIILRASENHEGNYSCSFGSTDCQFSFRLTVYQTQSKESEEWTRYPATCFAKESCRLTCPSRNIPSANTPNMTKSATIWRKNGDPSWKGNYFSRVDEKDGGIYTCTRTYRYHDHIYNISFNVVLQVKPKINFQESRITYPKKNQAFYVELGAPKVIDCKAVLYSDFDDIFWLSNQSFVEQNDSLPVFSNSTWDRRSEETRMTASLIFRSVSEEDLLKRYTCKLESDHQLATFVTIILRPKASSSYPYLALWLICFLIVILVAAALYLKFKISIVLYLQNTLGCCRSRADGKHYDAYLMCYKGDADSALSEEDRKWLVNVLEKEFGYSLCLFNQNATEKAEAEAVLDCIEQSRAVILVPTSSESEADSDVLTDIHTALLKRGTHFILINTTDVTTEVFPESSFPEAVQLLATPGDSVTWKGSSSKLPSSPFCKLLRYHLSAPLQAPRLHPQRNSQDANC